MSKINWVFQDEQGTNLNRYKATNVSSGEVVIFDLLRNGSISVVGTPLNASNLNSLISAINDNYDLLTKNEYTLSKEKNVISLNRSNNTNTKVTLTKSDLDLGNVDNTSDENKPISKETQQALNGKVANTTKVNGYTLDKDITLTKGDIGLGNVNNTSDENKPISTLAQAEFNAINSKISNLKNEYTGTIAEENEGFVKGGELFTQFANTIQMTKVVENTSSWTYSPSTATRFIIVGTNLNGMTIKVDLLNANGTSQSENSVLGLFNTLVTPGGMIKTYVILNGTRVVANFGKIQITSSGTFSIYKLI